MSSQSSELIKAKTLLGLHDKATLKEIKLRYKNLMKKWHPDLNANDLEKATQMSAKIIDAYKLIMEYCNGYEYNFKEEFITDQFISPEDWWNKKFQDENMTRS